MFDRLKIVTVSVNNKEIDRSGFEETDEVVHITIKIKRVILLVYLTTSSS
jgi:hypothetical protein